MCVDGDDSDVDGDGVELSEHLFSAQLSEQKKHHSLCLLVVVVVCC